ncbi:Asp23/Gls24 family envelope stress response protein [Streptomyces albidoflavus]|uniref:Asp23/Gls24 family envelope stress response protein n=1 Tax=Streptomyces TaxID=1883 RepID=UPI000524D800|nr:MULTISPECIES: Asp23/Gls24 family envelope stress response protein [Streptomyces]MCX5456875.1 Asp23/Gls24 family envelope stress response protein [Streptomyces sp. FT1]WAC97651.1 Asp23/Gls24 family envelope stress response protein [Streptomyces sp. NA13]
MVTDTKANDTDGRGEAGFGSGSTPGAGAVTVGRTGADAPAGDRGRTSIADVVVVKIAGTAAREIPGVFDMGAGLSRTLGAVRDRVPGGRPNVGRGVKAEVGERQTAIDLELVVEYGVPIRELASAVRENVISAVERVTGLDVVEVNIAIDDVRLPEEEGERGSLGESRVE